MRTTWSQALLCSANLDANALIQYTLCAVAMLFCLVWIVIKVVRKSKGKGGTCSGCSLSEACQSTRKNRNKENVRENPNDCCH